MGKQATNKAVPALGRLDPHVLEIKALVDSNPAVKIPGAVSHVPIYPTIADMIASTGSPDLAYVAVPHHVHSMVLSQLFSAKVNVLKEKPLAMTAAEGQALALAAKNAGVRLGVSAQRRFSLRYMQVQAWLPKIGQVRAAHATDTIPMQKLDEGWRASRDLCGGGVVLDLGYHMLDQLVGLLGETFSVMGSTLIRSHDSSYDVEDTAYLSIRFGESTQSSVVLSRVGCHRQETLEIIGEKGTIRLDDNDQVTLTLTSGHHEVFHCTETSKDMLARTFSNFARTNNHYEDLERDLSVMRLIDAIYTLGARSTQTPTVTPSNTGITKWSWPRVTPQVELVVERQLHTALSIYDNSGVFGSFELAFKNFHGQGDAFALLHNSGTNALHALYYSAGITKGDEVVVPVYTFHATVSPLMQLGAVPVFVDADPETGNIRPDGIRAAITSKTKAVIVTHMWGVPCDMDAISQICSEAGVLLLEGEHWSIRSVRLFLMRFDRFRLLTRTRCERF